MSGQTYTIEQIREFEGFMADPGRRAAFASLKRRYDHVFGAVFAMPWVIVPDYMEIIATVLVEHVTGDLPTPDAIAERIESANPRPPAESSGGVAVIPVHGPIVPRGGGLSEVSGATSVTGLRSAFRAAMADRSVRGIVMDIDSPGGSVFGIPEFADEIRAARGRKPITAAIDGIGASGAYWLAASADEIVMTSSSLTGSIGVVTAHEDVSAAAEKQGVKVTLISAGKHKVDGNPTQSLSDDARAHTQRLVDDYYAMFTTAVARGRGVPVASVRDGFGEGRVVNARMAMEEGMVDRVASLEDVVRGMFAAAPVAAMTSTTTTVPATLVVDPIPPITGFIESDGVVAGVDPETDPDADPRDTPGTPEWEAGTDTFLAALGLDPVTGEHIGDGPSHYDAAVDNSTWDGGRAMGQCSTAADYRSICAGERTTGEPDERQHWALPHHYLGRGPNAAGVRNALARLPQTQGLANRSAAESHLNRHMSEINPERASAPTDTLEAIEDQLALMRVSGSRPRGR